MDDLLKIAKLHSIKNSKALEIINKTIEIIKTFEDRAKEINLEESIIKECKGNIEYQISLLMLR
jgi:hypothetical protein